MNQQKQYTLELTQHLIRHCNPKPRQFYGSLMLKNNGKLILKVPKILEEIKTKDFQIISEE